MDGSDTGNSVGDYVEMLPTAAWGQDLADALTAQHTRVGGHKSITTDTITVSSGTTLPAGDIGTADLADSAVTSAKLAAGVPVQIVNTTSSAVTTQLNAIIPLDDTIPQNTEGFEVMTLAITPKSATNVLVIDAVVYMAADQPSMNLTGALFQDTTANALSAGASFMATTSARTQVRIRHTMTAGTTSSTTFKIRIGTQSNATTTFNGAAGSREFGAISKSSIVITEYKA